MDASINISIKMGNGKVVQLVSKGKIAIPTKKGTKFICDVLYVPKLDQNLLSVPQMVNNDYTLIFGNN